MKKIKLGIIGLGNMGTKHSQNIISGKCPNVELSAVCDLKKERIDAVLDIYRQEAEKVDFGEPRTFLNASEMFSSGCCDSVLIAVPHYDHPTLTVEAFRHGLHVLCEKPAGVYTLAVREMIAEADKHPELTFAMMFNQRTNPVYKKMKEIVASGELGSIRRTSWIITNWYRPEAYYESGDWRATWKGEGGGVLLNQCPHNLDLWQWICGMPSLIDAKLHYGKWHNIEVEDDVSAYVEYPNGATGTFITTTGDAPGANRFEIVMDGGTLICDKTKLLLDKLATPEPEFNKANKKPFGSPKHELIEIECDGENTQHIGVLNAFASHILHGEPLVADGREGINGLMISNAMHLSSWTKDEVTLPFDEEKFHALLKEKIATSKDKENVNAAVADTSGTY